MTTPITFVRRTANYEVNEINGLYHWEGLGAFDEICSDDGFEDLEECQADAVYWLKRYDGYDHSTCLDFVICAGLSPECCHQFAETPLNI